MLFICYPKCSTCKKAKKFLLDHQIEFDERHIVEEKLNKDELKALYLKSGLPLKRFFNTSGNLYKEKHLKDILEENDLVNNSDDKGRIEFFDSSNSEYKRERFFSNLKINVFNSKKCS